jgi:hypothetical protein
MRSVSKIHADQPFVLQADGTEHRVEYVPGESTTDLFGGNSNWRGPIWFPINFLLVEALERYAHFYGDSLTVECPTGSGQRMTLSEVARELSRRLASLFLPDATGAPPESRRRCPLRERPALEGPVALFYEYFHGDHGRGLRRESPDRAGPRPSRR